MSQGNEPADAGKRRGYAAKASELGHEAAEQIGEAAHRASRSASRAVHRMVDEAEEQAEQIADRQIGYGAELVGRFAEALRAASDVMQDDLPPLASLGYDAADRIDDFAETVHRQSAGDLLGVATEIARRRPAVLLGVAAASGFVLYRLASATARASETSRQQPAPAGRAPAGGPARPSPAPAVRSPAPAVPSGPSGPAASSGPKGDGNGA